MFRPSARPFATLAAVAVAWLLIPVALKMGLRASFFELTAPIAAAASHVRDLQDYWGLRLHSQNELIEAGRDLARINANYAVSAQQTASLQAEIGRLEDLLRLPALPHYRLEPARVAQRDFSSWWQRLVIRKGANYGLSVRDPVIYAGGVAGRVAEVHAYTAVVELISDPGVRLAAFFDGENRPVSFQGGVNPAFGPAQGRLEFVPLDIFASEAEPRRLVTSGLGGEFPAGLSLGRVVRLEPSTDGLFKTGVVELDPRLADLTEVTVLVPLPAAGVTLVRPATP
jgi:rod shape-determining protein MreC